MNIMDMSPREFSAFLEEERQYRTPEQIDDLMRRYNAANSLSGRLAGLLEPTEGRRRTNIVPASVPEGMSLFDAVRSGEAEFAVPQSIVDMIVGGVQGVENPGLAAQGRIPAADMDTAALQTAGTAMTGGGLAAGRGVLDYDPTTTRAFFGRDGGSIEDALELARSGRGIFHSSQADQFDEINKYGVEPQYGPWVKEVAEGATDDPSFLDDMPMAAWWSEQPDWVKTKTARAAGKNVNDVTVDDIRKYGHLSIADADEYADTVYRIPEEGIEYEGSEVSNLSGERMPLYATDLYEYGDDGVGRYPFGIERNELVTRESVEPKYSLTGQDLVDFLEQYEGNTVSANASKSAGLLSVASDVADRGDQILNMLKSGRGSEVTDAMLDMGDGVKNTQLNQYLAANYDLPMDEASRLSRAREMGLLDPAFHSTGKDFLNFVPSEFRGASFFGATPEGASRGASASANEGVGSGSKITMPVRVDTSGVEGLGAYARRDMNEFRASLPDRIYTEAEVDALMASDAAPLRGNWSDFFDDLTDYDALRQFRDENPTKEIPDGIVKFRPKRPVPYSKDLKTDLSGRQFAHYSEGMSERPTSEYVKSQGNTGFTMMDESGLALAMVDPTKVRSQFARFDPRLSHLSNVTAANASPISGLLAQSGVSSEQAQRIEDYLYRTGLLQ